MRKKQRLVQIKSDETSIHTVGQEQFVCVQKYTGDLPSGEPNDWFPQSDELAALLDYELAGYDPSEATKLLEDERLIDEW
jgi:hypothetical protein